MILKDKDGTRIFIKCHCGGEGIEISSWNWGRTDEKEYFIYHMISSFDSDQKTFFGIIKKRIQMAFYILRYGTHRFNEICLTANDFKELKEIIKDFE